MQDHKVDYNTPEASLKSIAWHLKDIAASLKIIAGRSEESSKPQYQKEESGWPKRTNPF